MTDELKLTVNITLLAELTDQLLNQDIASPDWVFALVIVPVRNTMIGGRAVVLANVPNDDVQHMLGNALRSLKETNEDDPVVTPGKPPSLS